MTRAKDHLFLTNAQYRGIRGARQRQSASAFLGEIGQEGVRRVELPAPAEPLRLRYRGADDFDDDPVRQREQIERQQDEFYDADAEPAEIDASANGGGLWRGCRVRHAKFGAGRVERVSREGPYTRVVVEFDRFGRKTLILEYARLEVLR